jgi:hypothetical protein
VALDPERRGALLQAKLGALVREAGAEPGTGQPVSFPGGAALVAADGAAWVLVEDEPHRALGKALAWSGQQEARDLHLLVPAAGTAPGVAARQAALFRRPPFVWAVDGRALTPAEPAAPTPPAVPPAAALELAAAITRAGARVVVEGGEVRGEVLGLEITRVAVEGDTVRLEVGVDRRDREAFTLLHGDLPPDEALATIIGTVRRHRRADARDHPLRRLAPERWLRESLLAHPETVGARDLEPVEAPVARLGIKDPQPAVVAGHDGQGRPIVVACSVGIDLELVPFAADARLAHAPAAMLVVAVPERDDHPVTRRLAAALAEPARIVTVAGDWRAAAPMA